ncbi:MAG: hypothetical protein H8D34_28770 [Chloroflexi bacterium]|nr:hypothetical protein [Chloroflexota bacterium]
MTKTAAQVYIQQQRNDLEKILTAPLTEIALHCAKVWDSGADTLNGVLIENIPMLSYCRSLYVMDVRGQQLSDTIDRHGGIVAFLGTDHSDKPYLNRLPIVDFLLSESYISDQSHKPSITAIQIIRVNRQAVGFLAATFNLIDLPLTATLYQESTSWRQMKGDPSIRGTLFLQQRTESVLDQHINNVIAVLNELIVERDIFHVDIHFSSNRAMIWTEKDRYRYHILGLEDLMDTDVCLAYERASYPHDAEIPADKIITLLNAFKDLRFADETIYLRIASINIFNGLVGLTFSCDGSHYMHYREFLDKNLGFWIGEATAGTSTIP